MVDAMPGEHCRVPGRRPLTLERAKEMISDHGGICENQSIAQMHRLLGRNQILAEASEVRPEEAAACSGGAPGVGPRPCQKQKVTYFGYGAPSSTGLEIIWVRNGLEA